MSKIQTFLVGGAVRDKILGREPKDLDFLMICSFDEMRAELLSQGAKIFLEKEEFNTIRCRHPQHGAADFQCATNLEENLMARDLNINSWAQDVEDGWFFGVGRMCLEKPLDAFQFIRFNPGALKGDPIRWIRAVRFSIELDLPLDKVELNKFQSKLVYDRGYDFDKERARAEFQKLFKLDTNTVLEALASWPILRKVFLDGIQLNPTLR